MERLGSNIYMIEMSVFAFELAHPRMERSS